MPITTLNLFAAILLVGLSLWQTKETPQANLSTKTGRPITIKLQTGEELRGELVQVDNETVDFKVKNILQSIELDKVSQINFQPVTQSEVNNKSAVHSMDANLRPTITYREKAVYTKSARDNRIEGTVVLSVVYTYDGRITDVRVVRGLPEGLTESAIDAVKRIRFQPALKGGQPVSVRGFVEFNFSL